MSGDTFTRDRFSWLEALAADWRLHSSAIRVAIVISSHLNRGSGEAWPSIKTIGESSSMPERTVKRAITALCQAGYLEKRRGGFGKSNRYAMSCNCAPETKPEQPHSEATGGPTDIASEATGGTSGTSIGAMGGTSVGPWVAPQSGHGWPTNPLIEPFEIEPIDKGISPPAAARAKSPKGKGREDASGFEEFYQAFPRKVSKGAARKAWGKAIKLASPATIIEAARRYAIERRSEDPKFTKHPATWLNAEAWHDEPAPPSRADAWPRFRASAKEQTGAAVAHILGHGGHSAGRRSTVDTILETLGGVNLHED